jgi:DNA-directed RNA polymerase specialized sigma24 family protein
MTDERNKDISFEECMPRLRAYARSLTRESDAADDLVQDTLLRA